MKPREKALIAAIGAVVGLVGLGFLLRAVVVKPLQEIDKKTATIRATLKKVQAERRTYQTNQAFLKDLALRTYSDRLDQASAKSGEMLTRLILQSGLRESDFTRMPFGPRRLRGAQEIGWSIQGDGKLSDVVDLLFLLQESPYVHRLESLNLSPADSPGQVRVSVRYLTLVIEGAPAVELADLAPPYSLYSLERKRYDELITRDILRPYIKRPPPAVAGAPATGRPGGRSTAPSAPAGPEMFKIVSLSIWMGQPEISVRDLNAQVTKNYKLGEDLAGGVIVMIDERPLPRPGKPGLLSMSRVILRIGTEYWAIELGQTLAQKYRLALEQVPENLTKL